MYFAIPEIILTLILIYHIKVHYKSTNSIGEIREERNFNRLWTYIYAAIQVLYIFRRAFLICQWKYAANPRATQAWFNFFTFVFMTTPEFIWFVIGNYKVFYGTNGLTNCSNGKHKDDYKHFHLIYLVIIYSWFLMVIYIITLLAITVILFGLTQYGMFSKKGQT